jgi:hypothetical protein
VLEALKVEAAIPPSVVLPQSAIQAISQYARKKGRLAARALLGGHGDSGHVRDLGDAALFGSSTSAIALADLALNAATKDTAKQRAEALAWLDLAIRLDHRDFDTKARADALRAGMTFDEIRRSKELLSVMAERRAVLLARPYD